jgi:hypothetical protein
MRRPFVGDSVEKLQFSGTLVFCQERILPNLGFLIALVRARTGLGEFFAIGTRGLSSANTQIAYEAGLLPFGSETEFFNRIRPLLTLASAG